MSRPETGTMFFGRDWPGLFIRGDNAFHFSLRIAEALAKIREFDVSPSFELTVLAPLEDLRDMMRLTDIRHPDHEQGLQQMKSFEECVITPEEA